MLANWSSLDLWIEATGVNSHDGNSIPIGDLRRTFKNYVDPGHSTHIRWRLSCVMRRASCVAHPSARCRPCSGVDTSQTGDRVPRSYSRPAWWRGAHACRWPAGGRRRAAAAGGACTPRPTARTGGGWRRGARPGPRGAWSWRACRRGRERWRDGAPTTGRARTCTGRSGRSYTPRTRRCSSSWRRGAGGRRATCRGAWGCRSAGVTRGGAAWRWWWAEAGRSRSWWRGAARRTGAGGRRPSYPRRGERPARKAGRGGRARGRRGPEWRWRPTGGGGRAGRWRAGRTPRGRCGAGGGRGRCGRSEATCGPWAAGGRRHL